MEAKPVPMPRSTLTGGEIGVRPIPAPRNLQSPQNLTPSRSTSSSESSTSEKSEESPQGKLHDQIVGRTGGPEFFRSLSNSSRNLKDEISEKMTSKSRAVISSTKNASLRLEKSVKNLLTRRLASVNSEDVPDDVVEATSRKLKDFIGGNQDRCVSMPTEDIFSGISFYSPLGTTLKSVRNEEDLSTVRYSPPPPIYPPPPLPEESIYDELQSVTSGHSSRYDTLSSTVSANRDLDLTDSFDLLSFARSRSSDSDLSVSNGEPNNLGEKITKVNNQRLSRSDSWTFYDVTPAIKPDRGMGGEAGVDLETISSLEEGTNESPIRESVFRNSTASMISIPNSLYENWLPKKPAPVSEEILLPSPTRETREQSKSLLFEFDPLSQIDENVYSNYENNDLMLLKALLATSESPSSSGSLADLKEEDETPEDETSAYNELPQTKEDVFEEPESSGPPPEPPKRFDSLPKNEYDEVELIEVPAGIRPAGKNPALLPKLSQIKKKQPAVPPRKPSIKIHIAETSASHVVPEEPPPPSPHVVEETRTSMIRKIQRKLNAGHESVSGIRPNVMSFVRGSKLLSRNREQNVKEPPHGTLQLQRPPYAGHTSAAKRGLVYRPGAGIERTKDLVPRAAVLADKKLSFYTDKSMTTLKETVLLETVHSIHLLQDVK